MRENIRYRNAMKRKNEKIIKTSFYCPPHGFASFICLILPFQRAENKIKNQQTEITEIKREKIFKRK
jgi:hypothetical protein